MQQQLGEVDKDFQHLHFTIVDLVEQQDVLEIEQAIFDDHEYEFGEIGDRLQQLNLLDESAKGESTAPPMRPELPQNPPRAYIGEWTTWKAL